MPTLNDPNNNPAGILSNGFQMGYAASMTMAAHAADDGKAYSIVYSGDPGGTDADFLYLKNTSSDWLRVYRIVMSCTADVEVTVKTGVTGTATNTTTVTPVNALIGSGETAEGDFYSRAGDLALTGGDTFDSLIYDINAAAAILPQVWDYPGEIALMKNQAMLFNNVTDPNASIRMTVFFYYHEPVEKP